MTPTMAAASLLALALAAPQAATPQSPRPRPQGRTDGAQAPDPAEAPDEAAPDRRRGDRTFAARLKEFTRSEGFLPLWIDARTGRVYLEIARFGEEILWQETLASAIGSGSFSRLDRGALGERRVVTFRRVGDRVLMEAQGYGHRAPGASAATRQAVADTFGKSVIAALPIVAEEPDGRAVVDAAVLVVRDVHGVAEALRPSTPFGPSGGGGGAGGYRMDRTRSYVDAARAKAFPNNVELDAVITVATEGTPSPVAREGGAPDPRAVTSRQHHSFVALPKLDEDDYRPRAAHPRIGYFTTSFVDYGAPFTGPFERDYIVRHRLKKQDPAAAVSGAAAPIVYYVDSAMPADVKQAVIDGAAQWTKAFEAAGFRDAYQVRELPADVDPLDIRYNVIYWVPRVLGVVSYGPNVHDPRTGRILKASIVLDGMQMNGYYMLLYAPFGPGALPRVAGSPLPQTVLDQIAMLAAHEVGHTLGLRHNFAGNANGGNGSVMDYDRPEPRVENGRVVIGRGGHTDIGPYDILAIRYGYTQWATPAQERAGLEALVEEARAKRLLFITDQDTGTHPLASQRDIGKDPVAAFPQLLAARKAALETYSPASVPEGSPRALVESQIRALYGSHAMQAAAIAKSLGGVTYEYGLHAASGGALTTPVPAAAQKRALAALTSALAPDELLLPARLLPLIAVDDQEAHALVRRTGEGRAGPVFDETALVRGLASTLVSALLNGARAVRMINQRARDAAQPGFDAVIDGLTGAAPVAAALGEGPAAHATRIVQAATVEGLLALGRSPQSTRDVRGIATAKLKTLRARYAATQPAASFAYRAHAASLVDDIGRFLERREAEPAATGRGTVTVETDPVIDDGLEAPRCGSYR